MSGWTFREYCNHDGRTVEWVYESFWGNAKKWLNLPGFMIRPFGPTCISLQYERQASDPNGSFYTDYDGGSRLARCCVLSSIRSMLSSETPSRIFIQSSSRRPACRNCTSSDLHTGWGSHTQGCRQAARGHAPSFWAAPLISAIICL